MRIVYNDWIQFRGYIAINIFGILFIRRDMSKYLTSRTINHESIHTEQYKEMLWLPFIVWYVVEYIVRLLICWNHNKAYMGISFEQEAYYNERNKNYIKGRTPFAWIGYLFKWNKL